MATGISFFPIDRIALLAANDFLVNPTMMMCTYLEWAAAMQELSTSGQLSLSASTTLVEVSVFAAVSLPPCAHREFTSLMRPLAFVQMAETLAQTPAACLDYFDAEYAKVDTDGEYAGYPISGHLLANISILDQKDPEHQHLPVVLTKPYAIIRLALKVRARRVRPGLWRARFARPLHRCDSLPRCRKACHDARRSPPVFELGWELTRLAPHLPRSTI